MIKLKSLVNNIYEEALEIYGAVDVKELIDGEIGV
jgi:hypothetical protein